MKNKLLYRRIDLFIIGLFGNSLELMNRSLGKSKHRNVLVAVIVPDAFLDDFMELIDQITFILGFGRFFLIVVTSIGGIESTDIVLTVDLIVVKHDDHSLLDGLLVLV